MFRKIAFVIAITILLATSIIFDVRCRIETVSEQLKILSATTVPTHEPAPRTQEVGEPSKISGFILRPPLVLEQIGVDDFDSYSGWHIIVQSGSPNIVVENSYLKISFSSAGYVLLGKKFIIPSSEARHKAIYAKIRIQSYTSTVAVAVGFWKNDGTNNNVLAIDTNEAAKTWRIVRKVDGSATFYDSGVSWQTGIDYELILEFYKSYAALYIPDANGNYEAFGKRWKRIAYTTDDISHIVGQDITVGIYVGTADSCEVWIDIIDVREGGGEGIKDPEILAIWEDGVRKAYRDHNGYYYVMVHLSATPTNNVKYGNGKLVFFRTTDLKDPTKYEYFVTIWDEHKVSGDAIIYNNEVVILYTDFSSGSNAGIGRARIPLNDFLSKSLASMIDEGIIISSSSIYNARDGKFFQDANGNWHMVITANNAFYVADLLNPLSSPTNIRIINGWHEYPPYAEHPGVLGVLKNNKLLGWASSSGGYDALKLGELDLNTNVFTDTNDPWYQDPNYSVSEAYDLAIVDNEIISLYQVPLEPLPTESGWCLFAFSAPTTMATPVSVNITSFSYYDAEIGSEYQVCFANRECVFVTIINIEPNLSVLTLLSINFSDGLRVEYSSRIIKIMINDSVEEQCEGYACSAEGVSVELSEIDDENMNVTIRRIMPWSIVNKTTYVINTTMNKIVRTFGFRFINVTHIRLVYAKTVVGLLESVVYTVYCFFRDDQLGVEVPAVGEKVDVWVNNQYWQTITTNTSGYATGGFPGVGYYAYLHFGLHPKHSDEWIGFDVTVGQPTTTYAMYPTITPPWQPGGGTVIPSVPTTVTPPFFSPMITRPSITSPLGLLFLALFLGLFIIYSKLFPWTQALAVSSGIMTIMALFILRWDLFAVFLILFGVGMVLWKLGR